MKESEWIHESFDISNVLGASVRAAPVRKKKETVVMHCKNVKLDDWSRGANRKFISSKRTMILTSVLLEGVTSFLACQVRQLAGLWPSWMPAWQPVRPSF